MPFWSKKGKEKARNQDALNVWASEMAPAEYPITSFQSVTADSQPNPTRERLKAYWTAEAELRRERIAKAEEAEGKCSIAYMAASEAAIEAINMCVEVSAREDSKGVSMVTDAQDAEMLKKYEETGEAVVPDKITRSSMETLLALHADCCCSNTVIKRDQSYSSKLVKERSFRGDNPIREACNGGSSSRIDQNMDGKDQKEDEAVHSGLTACEGPPGIDQDGDGLPSYKEAMS